MNRESRSAATGHFHIHRHRRQALLHRSAILLAAMGMHASLQAQPITPTAVPAPETGEDQRARDLVAKMTLDEKIDMIRGAQEDAKTDQAAAGYLRGVPRLGIPSMRFADGPPGILTREPSVALPATMALAATFSREDAEQNGAVVGLEARRLGVDVALEPFVNIMRDLNFSRGWNTYGEDPYLSGIMGAAQVRGIQGQGVMAQAKHYLGYDLRGYKTVMDEQTMHEVYLAPFEAVIDAGVSSLMCAYNYTNGKYACANDDLLNVTLRKELGFKGFVTSDWGAVHKPTDINTGLDMEMPGLMPKGSPWLTITRSYFDNDKAPVEPLKMTMDVLGRVFGRAVPEEGKGERAPIKSVIFRGQFPDDPAPVNMASALADGTVQLAQIDEAAYRVVHEMNRFGLLDRGNHQPTGGAVDPRIAPIIRKTASDSAVLLKNDGAALPLSQTDMDDLALIGPGAGQVVALGINAEHSLGLPETQNSVAALLQREAGGRAGAHVAYAVANDMTGTPIPADRFSSDGAPGLARYVDGRKIAQDNALNFTDSNANALPADVQPGWKGEIDIPSAGTYGIYLQMLGTHGELLIDGKLVGRSSGMTGARHGDTVQPGQDALLSTTDNLNNVRRDVELTAGKHSIEVTTGADTSHAPIQIRLSWVTPQQREANYRHAVETAAKAKKAVVFAWARQSPIFGLTPDQNKLIEDVSAANPNTIVVLNTSYPVDMPWLGKVKAVLNMWWGGDKGGEATVDILTGRVSPAGRLPFTWGKALEDYPATDPRYPERGAQEDGVVTYSEGLDVGYRWFDRQNKAPLYAFGHGLSYTSFAYSGLSVKPAADGGLDVRFTVANTGQRESDEVAQVYLGAPAKAPKGIAFPVRALAGFDRIHLAPSERKTISVHVAPRSLQYWDEKAGRWTTPKGTRIVQVGGSSRHLPLTGKSR
ncbi:beta-glucosidase [Sphingobium yanoikuyae]|uniref:beta-glucosidase n=1 Tax=Sphingobium yanoikuyae TaxID=13690 RepID=UPI0035C687D2